MGKKDDLPKECKQAPKKDRMKSPGTYPGQTDRPGTPPAAEPYEKPVYHLGKIDLKEEHSELGIKFDGKAVRPEIVMHFTRNKKIFIFRLLFLFLLVFLF